MVKEAAASSRERSTRHTESRDTARNHLQLVRAMVRVGYSDRMATHHTWRGRE